MSKQQEGLYWIREYNKVWINVSAYINDAMKSKIKNITELPNGLPNK